MKAQAAAETLQSPHSTFSRWNVAIVSLFTVSLLSFVQNYFAFFLLQIHIVPVVLVMFADAIFIFLKVMDI